MDKEEIKEELIGQRAKLNRVIESQENLNIYVDDEDVRHDMGINIEELEEVSETLKEIINE